MKTSRFDSWPVLAAGAAIASLTLLARRLRPARHGSQTNASDAVDDIELKANPTPDELLDAGVKQSFPASDPPSIGQAVESAYDRQVSGERPRPPEMAPSRSPDWMLEK